MDYELKFQESINCWESALPLGNGQTGCLIWGSPSHLRFSLDRTDIWDKTPAPGTERPEFTYRNLVRLAKEGDNDSIRKFFDTPYKHTLPTKLPAGKIIFSFEGYGNVASSLRLADGEAVLALEAKDRQAGQIRSIVHAIRGIGMISVDKPSGCFRVTLEAPEFGMKPAADKTNPGAGEELPIASLKSVHYEAPVKGRIECGDGCYLDFFEQKICEEFSYGVVMGVREEGGRTDIFYRVATSADGSFAQAREQLAGLLKKRYEALLEEHRGWWKGFWAMSGISLPDKSMERNWYITNYLLASCSREGYYPMPLQGVWTADEDMLPPWKGDYHNDLNTQMSYYHYMKANHLIQGKSFVDFLWDSREAGRAFARGFYGTRGQCLPAVMSIDGKPLGGWPMYSLSPANQIWLCRAFDDYYRYSGEEGFLEERAYPYFRETAECIGALLEKGEDGLLYLPISSSSEIHDDELEAFLTPNSNYDLALLHYFYNTLWNYAQKLLEAEKCQEAIDTLKQDARRWQDIRRKLPELAVDQRGVLMLAPDESLQESHRHHSHAHAIHPLRLLKYDTPEGRRIIDATINDLEELGTRMWVGYSFCWMAELYAIARQGDKAAGQLGIFWRNFCSPNGFHLNGDQKAEGYSSFTYRPFTLEANMCAADALQEMLLYGENGVIEVFPAIPRDWQAQKVSFERLRTEGGILVSAALEQGKLVSLVLEAPRQISVKLRGWSRRGAHQEGLLYRADLQQGENRVL